MLLGISHFVGELNFHHHRFVVEKYFWMWMCMPGCWFAIVYERKYVSNMAELRQNRNKHISDEILIILIYFYPLGILLFSADVITRSEIKYPLFVLGGALSAKPFKHNEL